MDIRLFSPAKVNLFLHFVSQRKDGYHNLQTVFALLNWGDSIQLSITQDYSQQHQVTIQGMATVPLEQNLIYKAVIAYAVASGLELPCIAITVEKKIPMGAGLGGGSSNAASVLIGLNQYFQALPLETLIKIGAALGADVAVFISQNHAWAEGIGDQLYPIKLQPTYLLLALPKVSVNTALAFKSTKLERTHEPLQRLSSISCDNWSHNHFEPVIRELYPLVNNCFERLAQIGQPRLSGSGSSVFVAFETQREANQALAQLNSQVGQEGLDFDIIMTRSL